MLHCVQEVRKAAAVGVARAKESHGSPDETATTRLCSSDMCDIQHENAILNRMVSEPGGIVEPLNNGTDQFVHYKEVVFFLR